MSAPASPGNENYWFDRTIVETFCAPNDCRRFFFLLLLTPEINLLIECQFLFLTYHRVTSNKVDSRFRESCLSVSDNSEPYNIASEEKKMTKGPVAQALGVRFLNYASLPDLPRFPLIRNKEKKIA